MPFQDHAALINAWTLVGHASYLLLVVSMSMRQMLSLRLLAVGSGLLGLAYAALYLGDWVGGVWELAFVLVNATQLSLLLVQRARARRWTAEEWRLRGGPFAGFDDHQFERLLRVGEWRDLRPGECLTVEGEEVPALVLLESGRVEIHHDHRLIANCRAGDFVGEIGFLSAQPATATARAATAGRYLRFDREALRRLLSQHSDLDQALGQLFNSDLIRKLIAASAGGPDRRAS